MPSRAVLLALGTCISWTLTMFSAVKIVSYDDAPTNMAVLFPGSSSSSTQQQQQHETKSLSSSSVPPPPPPAVVHVVTTRFMQRQSHLLSLGRARMKLFETFCLPTMIHQSSSDFLWLIMVDPELDVSLMEHLQSLVSPFRNFFIIQSNEYLLDLRATAATGQSAFVDESLSITSGDISLLQQAALASQSSILIETSLDADDGLHPNLLALIRHVVTSNNELLKKNPSKSKSSSSSSSSWMALCIDKHFEWHMSSQQAAGILRYTVKRDICVMAGLSFARASHVSRAALFRGGHHMLQRTLDDCHNTTTASTTTPCLYRLTELKQPQAIRARTTTSAGMADVSNHQDNGNNPKKVIDKFWEFLRVAYGIERQRVVETQEYLVRHAESILQDNLQGQCTKGHSCKEETKKKLFELLKESTNSSSSSNVKQ